jgi:hypothetical protein
VADCIALVGSFDFIMEGFEDDIVYEVIFDDLGGALGMSLKRNEEVSSNDFFQCALISVLNY